MISLPVMDPGTVTVHVKLVPGIASTGVKFILPLGTITDVFAIVGTVGPTMILNDLAVPLQPFAVGITMITAVSFTTPVFTAVKNILGGVVVAEPDEARPIVVLLLLHV